MIKSDKKVMVGLYFKGDRLDPAQITAMLGVTPTTAHAMGERRTTSTGLDFQSKVGLWSYVVDQDPGEASDVVDRLIGSIGAQGRRLAGLPGVQDAYVDVFVAADSDHDGQGSFEMVLSNEHLTALSGYGLPIRLTVSMGRP